MISSHEIANLRPAYVNLQHISKKLCDQWQMSINNGKPITMSHHLQSFHKKCFYFYQIVITFDIAETLLRQPSFSRGLYSEQHRGLRVGSPCPLSDQPSEIFELPTARKVNKFLNKKWRNTTARKVNKFPTTKKYKLSGIHSVTKQVKCLNYQPPTRKRKNFSKKI